MRALTYTSSIPMVLWLLRDYDYDDFECVFGHGGVLSQDARTRWRSGAWCRLD